MGGVLTPEIVFPSLFCFEMTVWELLSIPESIANVVSGLESVRRISRFLALPEVAGLGEPTRVAQGQSSTDADHHAGAFHASARFDGKKSAVAQVPVLETACAMTRRYHRVPEWMEDEESDDDDDDDDDSEDRASGSSHSIRQELRGEEKEERDMFLELFCGCLYGCESTDGDGGQVQHSTSVPGR